MFAEKFRSLPVTLVLFLMAGAALAMAAWAGDRNANAEPRFAVMGSSGR
jgi:hypothetical protein